MTFVKRVQIINRRPEVFCATVLEFERRRYNRYYRYLKLEFLRGGSSWKVMEESLIHPISLG
jgi:hypothetical protein